jgi:hypothetical protein
MSEYLKANANKWNKVSFKAYLIYQFSRGEIPSGPETSYAEYKRALMIAAKERPTPTLTRMLEKQTFKKHAKKACNP